MKEVMSSITNASPGNIPADLTEYNAINFKTDKNGHPLWFGENAEGKNRRIKADIVLVAFGHEPREKFEPQPAPAIWRVNGQEQPVVVNGIVGANEKGTFYSIEDSDTGVPLSQIEWISETSNEDNDELTDLRLKIEGLSSELGSCKSRLKELEKLESENQKLNKEKEKLEDRLKLLEANQPSKNPPTDFEENQEIIAIVDGRIVDATIDSEPIWDKKRNEWVFEVVADEVTLYPTIHQLRAWQELDADEWMSSPLRPEIVPRPKGKASQAWLRTRGKLGGWLSGQSAMAAVQSYQPRRVRQVTETEYYHEEDVKRGDRLLGGAALVAAGVIIGALIDPIEDYFENRHGVPKSGIGRHIREQSGGVSSGGGNLSNRHVDFYNGPGGHRLTAVDDPQGLTLKGARGSERFVNSHGKTVISNVQWDRQGKLAVNIRNKLNELGFKVRQGKLGSRYMSTIWNK